MAKSTRVWNIIFPTPVVSTMNQTKTCSKIDILPAKFEHFLPAAGHLPSLDWTLDHNICFSNGNDTGSTKSQKMLNLFMSNFFLGLFSTIKTKVEELLFQQVLTVQQSIQFPGVNSTVITIWYNQCLTFYCNSWKLFLIISCSCCLNSFKLLLWQVLWCTCCCD